jgi:phage terminase small subunit
VSLKGNPSQKNGLAHARRQQRAALAGVVDPNEGMEFLPRDARPIGKLSAAARAYFDSILRGAPTNHFFTSDMPVLEQYCVFLARLDKDRDAFEEAPRTQVYHKNGKSASIHPVVKLYLELEDRVQRMRYQLRLDPSQRPKTQAQRDAERGSVSRVAAPPEEEASSAAPAAREAGGRRAGLLFGRAALPAHRDKE